MRFDINLYEFNSIYAGLVGSRLNTHTVSETVQTLTRVQSESQQFFMLAWTSSPNLVEKPNTFESQHYRSEFNWRWTLIASACLPRIRSAFGLLGASYICGVIDIDRNFVCRFYFVLMSLVRKSSSHEIHRKAQIAIVLQLYRSCTAVETWSVSDFFVILKEPLKFRGQFPEMFWKFYLEK